MGRVYREKTVPVPENCYFDKNKVMLKVGAAEAEKKNPKRILIGYLAENYGNGADLLMYPNNNYRYYLPELYKQFFGDDNIVRYTLYIGLFALINMIIHITGLYSLLIKLFGIGNANAIIDLAMYSILYRDNSFHLVSDRLKDHLTFSNTELSDSYISDLMNKELDNNKIEQFKQEWMSSYFKNRKVKILIGGDGSNNDNKSDSSLAEKGHSKSKKNDNIISFMFIVDAETNDPIAYDIIPGSVPDCQSIKKVINSLTVYNATIDAIVLDRNFFNMNVINMLDGLKIPYVIMATSDNYAFNKLVDKYGSDLQQDPNYMFENKPLSGVAEYCQIFKNESYETNMNIIYEDINGASRRETFKIKILEEIKRIKNLKTQNKKYEIKPEFTKYIQINDSGDIVFNKENYIHELNKKGMYGIISKENYGPEITNEKYSLRNSSCEGQFNVIKNQLGYDTFRSHSTEGIASRMIIAFICVIIRNEIFKLCKDYIDVNKLVIKLSRVALRLIPDNKYVFINDIPQCLKKFFNICGLSCEYFSYLQDVVNTWQSGKPSFCYQHTDPRKVTGEEKELVLKQDILNESNPEQNFAGASLNTAPTLEAEPDQAQNLSPAPTPEAEPALKANTSKRGRGRPKGSKNKPKPKCETELSVQGSSLEETKPKRKRGRPLGSKNKKKHNEELSVQSIPSEETKTKRKRGRPLGSKNKTTR